MELPLLPTSKLYASDTPIFSGKYAATRRSMDYAYHPHWTVARQVVQDEIVDHFLCATSASAAPPLVRTGSGSILGQRPWLLYTAGPMGAGKSHVMKLLGDCGAFPAHLFVVVDPDQIKSCLPEMATWVAAGQRELAGSLTHHESGFISEIVERESLRRGANILIDGSLRNMAWYQSWFAKIRADYPAYRIAILSVAASPERVYERVARRAVQTGRDIPRALLDDTIQQVSRSVEVLGPLADFCATIQNDVEGAAPDFPRLKSFQALMGTNSNALDADRANENSRVVA